MLSIPCPRPIWAEAYRNPELGRFFDAEVRRERIRHEAWSQEVAAGAKTIFVRRSPQQLLDAARAAYEARHATPEGRFSEALADVNELIVKLGTLVSQARILRDAGFEIGLPRQHKLGTDMHAAVGDLKAKVLDLQLAIDDAYAGAEAAA